MNAAAPRHSSQPARAASEDEAKPSATNQSLSGPPLCDRKNSTTATRSSSALSLREGVRVNARVEDDPTARTAPGAPQPARALEVVEVVAPELVAPEVVAPRVVVVAGPPLARLLARQHPTHEVAAAALLVPQTVLGGANPVAITREGDALEAKSANSSTRVEEAVGLPASRGAAASAPGPTRDSAPPLACPRKRGPLGERRQRTFLTCTVTAVNAYTPVLLT